MRSVEEKDLKNVVMFLGLPSIRPKIALDFEHLETSLRAFLKNPNLGHALISEDRGKITGFLVHTIEFAEQKQGDHFWILESVGLSDEIEVDNNLWFRDVYAKQRNCVEIGCWSEIRHSGRIDQNLVPVFRLKDYGEVFFYSYFEAKL